MEQVVVNIAQYGAGALEIMGVGIIVIVAIYSILMALFGIFKNHTGKNIYEKYRHLLARGILFGLELLVAADIIHTVAVDLTFENVGVLAIVVVIRTFLSFTLQLEASGRWPWQTIDKIH